MHNRLIVIEGGDGAGKETQAKMAVAALRADYGHGIEYFDFPRYGSSVAGKLIRSALDGEFGDFKGLHPKLASLPYTLDRISAKPDICTALKHSSVLCNRYTPSNAMYQGAKYSGEEAQNEFIAWLEQLEYGEYWLPKPDLVFYLHVPFEISRGLMQGRRALDQHEQDEQYQRDVIDLYLRTARERRDWEVIECVEDGQLRSREEIHQLVMEEVLR